ncbi:pitrilysin family protein [Sphingomonas sp. ASV193]|uniref:M16 family metallopeptidase n=1 Tax=Sphingomonas sp. ASV193 TaxID=3144405 RepID=UPI0032E8F262
MTKRTLMLLLSASLLTPVAAIAAAPQPAAVASLDQPPAPLSSLARSVALPHTEFKLPNGLTVLVHEDHKAPVVAFSVWYGVGSTNEPARKTGFAHLYEHLMFYGSDNLRENILGWLEKTGATDWNGTTWYDRTNYFETVPKSALEKVLFMESDRMGYLLPAIDQKRLDLQRGVVQNEKRQGDNAPGGLIEYAELENLFPAGHPFHHTTIGSMADLDAASLADVKRWFLDHYAPNNAVVSLAGDITPAEARTLMTKYFGAIPAGPKVKPVIAPIPTLPAARRIVMKDRVAAVTIHKYWAVPGYQSNELEPLDVGVSVLGGLGSSKLDKTLVRDEKIAVSVSAGIEPHQKLSLLEVSATVKPGTDPALVEKRLDEVVAAYIANGPTADDVRRAVTSEVGDQIRALEKVGGFSGQAGTLAEGKLFTGSSDYYKASLARYAAATPAQVRGEVAKWMGRPALTIVMEPGERPPYDEAKPVAAPRSAAADIPVASVKRTMPPAGPAPALVFPQVQHVRLSNGIAVDYAQRTAAPLTQMALMFDAGVAADAPTGRGLQNMTVSLLDEGAGGMTSQQIAEAKERLGASIGAAGSSDDTTVTLSALSANLAPSLALVRTLVERPDFNPSDIDRVRSQLLTGIAQAKTDPGSIARRALPALLYGEASPYGGSALGDEAAVKGFTRADLMAFKDRWLRPDKARLFVVSDEPLAKILPLLDAAFGHWQAPATPAGVKQFGPMPAAPAAPRIVLIDRPGSPQSVILGGQLTPVDPRGDTIPVMAASDVFGGMASSRLNLDLREQKSWSYGAGGGLRMQANAVPYLVSAPVQADRTGESIAEIVSQLNGMNGGTPITAAELSQAVANNVDGLPGQFETGAAVLSAMIGNAQFGRPDNYYETFGPKFRALTPAQADAAFKAAIRPTGFTFVVVGDAKTVKPQLDKLGYNVEVQQPR